jgi:HEAT repeat protein
MMMLAFLLMMASVDEKEVEEALQKFKAAMKSPEATLRADAVRELGRLKNDRTLRVLGSCLAIDDKLVRMAAAKALGSFQEKRPQAAALLAEALTPNAREPEVEVEIFSALKELREESALGACYAHFEDKNFKVAEAAIGVTAAVRSRRSVDPLIRLMKKLLTAGDGVSSGDGSFDVPPDEALRERARKLEELASSALQSISGEKLSTAAEWDAWWKRHAATFRIKD